MYFGPILTWMKRFMDCPCDEAWRRHNKDGGWARFYTVWANRCPRESTGFVFNQ